MHVRTALFAAAVAACLLAAPGAAPAAVLHGFSTTDATLNPDDGYSAAAVTVTTAPGVVAPANGTALGAGNTGLVRFWNTEWAGFSASSNNGAAIDTAAEFAAGYFTWTVAADPGSVLNLSSLTFDSARGGGDPALQVRGFRLYAETNGGTFDLADTPVLTVQNETGTRTTPAPVPRAADLSGAAFQGVDSITFRYYPLTPANGNTIDFANVVLNGEVVVPEPSAAAVVGCALLALLRRNLRHANAR